MRVVINPALNNPKQRKQRLDGGTRPGVYGPARSAAFIFPSLQKQPLLPKKRKPGPGQLAQRTAPVLVAHEHRCRSGSFQAVLRRRGRDRAVPRVLPLVFAACVGGSVAGAVLNACAEH